MTSGRRREARVTGAAERRRSPLLIGVVAASVIIATLYVIPLFVPDPSLPGPPQTRSAVTFRRSGRSRRKGCAAVTDDKHYRSATAPLYHMLMSVALDRVDPIVLRVAWVIVTLGVGVLLYRHVRTDVALLRANAQPLRSPLRFS